MVSSSCSARIERAGVLADHAPEKGNAVVPVLAGEVAVGVW